eukprot:6977458-Prymnesium_polylepis.1
MRICEPTAEPSSSDRSMLHRPKLLLPPLHVAEEASWMHFCFAAAARAIAKLDLLGCHLWGVAPPVAERRVRPNRLRGWHDLVQSCEV